MKYREKLLAIGTVDLCGLVDLDRAEQVAIEADAEIAGLRADAERIDAQWRDELRIYRETENADAERWRFVRMMNPREFSAMWARTIVTCAQFDELIDAARANGGEG